MKQPATGLNLAQERFVLEYVGNEGNATRAYRAAYPNCQTDRTAGVEGFKLLKNPKILAAIDAAKLERFKRLQISGDEALALISMRADPDWSKAYDANGKRLPIRLWPRELRCCVRGIKANGDIVLHDGLKASELMAVATGRLRSKLDVNHTFDHEKYLAGETDKEGGDDE